MADLYESVEYKEITIKIYNRLPPCVMLPNTVKTAYEEVSRRDFKKSFKKIKELCKRHVMTN